MTLGDIATGHDAAEIFDREFKEQGYTRMFALLFNEEIVLVAEGRTIPDDVEPGLARYTSAEVNLLVGLKLKPNELKAMHLAKKELGGVFMANAPEPSDEPKTVPAPPKACPACGEWFWRSQARGFACGWCAAPGREVIVGDRKRMLDLANQIAYPEMILSPAAKVRGCMESWERFGQFAKAGAVTSAIDWLLRRAKKGVKK